MTLTQLNAKMGIGVARPDLTADDDADYTAYLNAAQKEICQAHSFKWMKDETNVTITGGSSYAALPAAFKELVNDETPIWLADTSSGSTVYRPVNVWTAEKVRRWQQYTASTEQLGYIVYVDHTSSPPRLNIGNGTAVSDLVFKVHYYAFPTDLSDSNTSNTLTNDHPSMLLDKAKSLAFADINDPATVDFENLFLSKFRTARAHDTYSKIAGLQLHM